MLSSGRAYSSFGGTRVTGFFSSRRRLTFMWGFAVAAMAASFIGYSSRAHAATVDAGVCTVSATLSFGPPALQGASHVYTNLPYVFNGTSTTCVSGFGSTISWSGGGYAQEASCTSLVNLLGISESIAAGQQYIGVTTSGAGSLTAQHWVFSTLNADLTATGTFAPTSPLTPTQQCLAGGVSTIQMTGAITFELRTIF